MKKIFLLAAVVLMASVTATFAVETSEISAAVARAEKLAKLNPEKVNVASIDAFGSKAKQAATQSIEITNTLNKYYALTGGEMPEGVSYEGAVPTLEEVKTIEEKLKAQMEVVKESAEMAVKATGDLKDVKPLAIAKTKKSIETSKEIFQLVAQDTQYQTQLLQGVLNNIAGN